MGNVWAISDLHVGHEQNRDFVDLLVPETSDDWLIVAGDVAEYAEQVLATLACLRRRWRRVIWTPGNHELWTLPSDPCQLRGAERYEYLVSECRAIGVDTPEDHFPTWHGPSGSVVVAPLFLLYDYSFRPSGISVAEALSAAHRKGVVCNDEYVLYPDPYPTREQWCAERVRLTRKRLDALPDGVATVLVNHFPLNQCQTSRLYHREFALWCGTNQSASWHLEYRATDVIYGHLHIAGSEVYDGVRFHEVSIGYPRERAWRSAPLGPRLILQDVP